MPIIAGCTTRRREPFSCEPEAASSDLAAVSVTGVFRRAPAEKGLRGVDEEALSEYLAADEHPKTHLIAVCEGDLAGDFAPRDREPCHDDETILDVARRTAHRPSIVNGRLDGSDIFEACLPGAHQEPHIRHLVALELFDIEGVQRRSARARVDFRLDPRDVHIGKIDPFTPAQEHV